MKAIAVFLLFLGVVLIMQGFYARKGATGACPAQKVQIKYVPRELIDEQMAQDSKLDKQFAGMFDSINPREKLKQ